MDGGILVISSPDRPAAQTRERIFVVCFMNKVDVMDDAGAC